MLVGGLLIMLLTLTVHRARQHSPAPAWIAFAGETNSTMQLFRMRPDGSHLEQLTHENAILLHPVWSPDGTALLLVWDNRAGETRLQRLELATGLIRPVSSELINVVTADWSRDGQQLVVSGFFRSRPVEARAWQVFTMQADGQAQRMITYGEAYHSLPRWSPDSKALLFLETSAATPQVQIADLRGRVIQTFEATLPLSALWSPDGTQVGAAVIEDHEAYVSIFAVASGAEAQRIPLPFEGVSLVRLNAWAGQQLIIEVQHGQWVAYVLDLQTQTLEMLPVPPTNLPSGAVWSPVIEKPFDMMALLVGGVALGGSGLLLSLGRMYAA